MTERSGAFGAFLAFGVGLTLVTTCSNMDQQHEDGMRFTYNQQIAGKVLVLDSNLTVDDCVRTIHRNSGGYCMVEH